MNYRSLVIISNILKALGVLNAALGVLYFIVSMASASDSYFFDPMAIIISFVIVELMALYVYASGEFIALFVDIANSVRFMAKSMHQNNTSLQQPTKQPANPDDGYYTKPQGIKKLSTR